MKKSRLEPSIIDITQTKGAPELFEIFERITRIQARFHVPAFAAVARCFDQLVYLAGMAFNNASLGHVHAMAHQLGGFYDLPHGVCNAILLPHVQRFNMIAKMNRFADIARAMGEPVAGLSARDAAERALAAIGTLSRDVPASPTV